MYHAHLPMDLSPEFISRFPVFIGPNCTSEDMFRSLFLVASLATTVFSQTCSNTGAGPCLNGLCSTGYTCTNSGTICCLNSNIVTCADKVNPNTGISDCSRMAAYCSNSAYKQLMTEQCPKTCNLCGTVITTTVKPTCVDKKNPNTGVSDCPRLASYCNNSAYRQLMVEQCPKTCALC